MALAVFTSNISYLYIVAVMVIAALPKQTVVYNVVDIKLV